jgi:hypothetical protein
MPPSVSTNADVVVVDVVITLRTLVDVSYQSSAVTQFNAECLSPAKSLSSYEPERKCHSHPDRCRRRLRHTRNPSARTHSGDCFQAGAHFVRSPHFPPGDDDWPRIRRPAGGHARFLPAESAQRFVVGGARRRNRRTDGAE